MSSAQRSTMPLASSVYWALNSVTPPRWTDGLDECRQVAPPRNPSTTTRNRDLTGFKRSVTVAVARSLGGEFSLHGKNVSFVLNKVLLWCCCCCPLSLACDTQRPNSRPLNNGTKQEAAENGGPSHVSREAAAATDFCRSAMCQNRRDLLLYSRPV
jgi:hypothetical protein